MRYSTCKEIDTVVKDMIRQGWSYTRGKKHGRLRRPDGRRMITVPTTPSDWRASLNFKRDLRHLTYRTGQ